MSVPILAVVDIGSNSIKILVAAAGTPPGPALRVLFQESLETRISAGLGKDRSRLSDAGIAAGMNAIRCLLEMAAPHSPTHRLIVATSAVRDAQNRAEFAARVQDTAGVPLEILSGEDEARLIARGIQTDTALGGATDFCVLDLGGGSLECIRYQSGNIHQAVSLQLGAVRLTEKFVPDPRGPFTVQSRAAITQETRRKFLASGFEFIPGGLVVGTGGAFTVVRAIFAHRRGFTAKDAWPAELRRADIETLLDEIASLTAEARAHIPRLTPERADIMPAALTTILALLKLAGADHVIHSFNNLRFGVAARFFAQLGGEH